MANAAICLSYIIFVQKVIIHVLFDQFFKQQQQQLLMLLKTSYFLIKAFEVDGVTASEWVVEIERFSSLLQGTP